MNKNPVFLGVYSKILPAGDQSAESRRRWHVWSLEAGRFLIQEILPDQKQGETRRIDSGEFFNTYRVHAAFSSEINGQNPTPDAPAAGTWEAEAARAETRTQMRTNAPAGAQTSARTIGRAGTRTIGRADAAPRTRRGEHPAGAEESPPPPPHRRVYEQLEKDDGLGSGPLQARSVVEEDLYPVFSGAARSGRNAAKAGSATFYAPKSVPPEETPELVSDPERLEEQLRSDFSLALIRLQTDRDKTLESLNKIVDSRTKFEKKHKFMFSDFGTALRRRRLYSLAFRFHERAKELAPDDEHILFNMARAMFDAGKVEQARTYLRQAVAMSGDFQAGTDFLAFIEGKYSHRL